MTKPRTIKAWGVFTRRGDLLMEDIKRTRREAVYLAGMSDCFAADHAPHTVRRVTITVED